MLLYKVIIISVVVYIVIIVLISFLFFFGSLLTFSSSNIALSLLVIIEVISFILLVLKAILQPINLILVLILGILKLSNRALEYLAGFIEFSKLSLQRLIRSVTSLVRALYFKLINLGLKITNVVKLLIVEIAQNSREQNLHLFSESIIFFSEKSNYYYNADKRSVELLQVFSNSYSKVDIIANSNVQVRLFNYIRVNTFLKVLAYYNCIARYTFVISVRVKCSKLQLLTRLKRYIDNL